MDDVALQTDIHMQAMSDFSHHAQVNNQKVFNLLHASRHESDLASRETAKYFEAKAEAKPRGVLPAIWYVPGGVKDYLNNTTSDPWDFDSHIPKLDVIDRCMYIGALPAAFRLCANNFI